MAWRCSPPTGTTTSSDAPRPWEVWHARFDFSEGKRYKYRPIIVVDIAEDGSIVTMVTSATSKLHLEHDYPISDWKGAGLGKPSIARADRIARIPAGYLGTAGRIGRLGDEGIQAITRILAEISAERGVGADLESPIPWHIRPAGAAQRQSPRRHLRRRRLVPHHR